MALNRAEWKRRIYAANLRSLA